jgi:ribosome-binding factor A
LGKIIAKEIEFPKGIFVTLTRVETSKDLSESKVFISCFPKESSKEVFENLEKEIFFIQKKLNEKLVMRKIPRIKFFEEEKTAQAAKIEEILEKLKKEKK